MKKEREKKNSSSFRGVEVAKVDIQIAIWYLSKKFSLSQRTDNGHKTASSPAKVSSYLPFDKPFASRPSKFIISAD